MNKRYSRAISYGCATDQKAPLWSIPSSRLRRATSLLNPSATAYAVPPPFKKGRHYGRLWVSATSYGCTTIQKAPLGIKGAHEARALWAKQREVSPMKQGVPQASLRAQWNDHAELRGAWAHNTPRRKIPFSRAKIASLQFPRPEIRRILAETGRGARRPRAVRETGRSKPNEQGSIASRQAQQDDHCELWMW